MLESSDVEGWVRFEMWQNNESFPEARKAAKKDAVRDEPLETCLSYRKL